MAWLPEPADAKVGSDVPLLFDLKSASTVSQDEEGIELPDAEAAHDMALGTLVDTAREAVVEGSSGQSFAVEVRNGAGPILEVTAIFNSKFFKMQ